LKPPFHNLNPRSTFPMMNFTNCTCSPISGPGHHNMTSVWHGELSDDDYYDLVKFLRPRYLEDIVYPKTTRLLAGGVPLGYVKLTI
jgi:hypothetical protein